MNKEGDTVFLLRGVMKISIALSHLDDIIEKKRYHRFAFKKESNRWAKNMEVHTSNLMSILVAENSELLIEIYGSIESSLDGIQAGEFKTSLICFYSMIRSAINDIEKMEDRDQIYAKFIEIATNKVVKSIERQYLAIINTKDEKGNDCEYIVSYLDDLGEQIMINKDESNKNRKKGILHTEGRD